jgi:hypothetical protein
MFKTKRIIRVLSLTILVLLASVPAFAGDDAPSWLKQAAAQSVPGYEKTVTAVVLRD